MVVWRSAGAAPAPDARSALGAKALGLLHQATVHEDPDIRVLALEQWGELGNRAVIPLLQKALKDGNRYVRIAAAGSLYQLGDTSGVKVLEAIVSEKPAKGGATEGLAAMEELRALAKNKIRVAAVRALAHMGSASSLPVLKRAQREEAGSVRDAATAGLARMGGEEELSRFLAALDDDDTGVRVEAVRALGEIATPAVTEPLQRMAKDPSYQVRAAAMEGLGATLNPAVLPVLAEGAKDQNDLVRSRAVAGLGRLQNPGAAGPLRESLGRAGNAFIEMVAIAGLARLGQEVDLGVAQRSLSQPDADTRVLAVEVLEAVGGPKAVEHLDFALDDMEMRVRVRAAAALVKLLGRRAEGPR